MHSPWHLCICFLRLLHPVRLMMHHPTLVYSTKSSLPQGSCVSVHENERYVRVKAPETGLHSSWPDLFFCRLSISIHEFQDKTRFLLFLIVPPPPPSPPPPGRVWPVVQNHDWLFPQAIDVVLMTSERPQAHHISAAPVDNPYTLYYCTAFSRSW